MRSKDKGQAIVEFALVVPAFFLLFSLGLDVANLFLQQILLENKGRLLVRQLALSKAQTAEEMKSMAAQWLSQNGSPAEQPSIFLRPVPAKSASPDLAPAPPLFVLELLLEKKVHPRTPLIRRLLPGQQFILKSCSLDLWEKPCADAS